MKQKDVIKRICAYCKSSVIFNREQTGYYVPDQMKIACSDECLDRLIWETMVSMGWILPTTPEAVAIAERMMGDEPIPSLPDRLRMPPKLPDLDAQAIEEGKGSAQWRELYDPDGEVDLIELIQIATEPGAAKGVEGAAYLSVRPSRATAQGKTFNQAQ